MPYVLRNPAGKIIALLNEAGTATEFLPGTHPDIRQFLGEKPAGVPEDVADQALAAEDLKLIRAIEDVIDLLIAKNVIIFSELPVAVQQKILKKRGYRENLFGKGGDLIGPEEGIL